MAVSWAKASINPPWTFVVSTPFRWILVMCVYCILVLVLFVDGLFVCFWFTSWMVLTKTINIVGLSKNRACRTHAYLQLENIPIKFILPCWQPPPIYIHLSTFSPDIRLNPDYHVVGKRLVFLAPWLPSQRRHRSEGSAKELYWDYGPKIKCLKIPFGYD